MKKINTGKEIMKTNGGQETKKTNVDQDLIRNKENIAQR